VALSLSRSECSKYTFPLCAQFVKGDIQSLDLVLHLLASEEVDTVMHFAAQVGGTAEPLPQQWNALSAASEHYGVTLSQPCRQVLHFMSTNLASIRETCCSAE